MLDVFVVDQYNNAVKDELIHLYRENISQCQNNQITSQYSEKDIQDIQKLKKDMSIQQAELDQHLKEIAAMNQKEMVQLISLVNEYIALRMQEAERKCFGENHI